MSVDEAQSYAAGIFCSNASALRRGELPLDADVGAGGGVVVVFAKCGARLVVGPAGTDATRVVGRLSIQQFFNTIPEIIFAPESCECGHVAAVLPLTLIVLSGNAAVVGQLSTVHEFQTTMHLRLSDESRAAIVSQSFFLLTPSE
jgi:hypothetical protein